MLKKYFLFGRAEGDNPVLPGTSQTAQKSDDDDPYDDDQDEQCKSILSFVQNFLQH